LVASLVYGIFNQIAGGYSFGKLGCLVSYYCVVTPVCVSITTLGVVAWERYQIVCKGNQWSDTKITAWIIAIWGFFGLLLAIPMITSNYVSIRLEPNSMNCNVKWYDWSPQSLVMTVMIMTLSGIAYSVVFYSYYNVYMTYSAVTKKKKTNQDNQRIIFKKCVAMTLCLIVLWSTYYLKMFYEFVSGKSTNADWTSIANMSGILCSILNPIIMCMYDNRVRGNMLAVFEVFRKVPARVSVGSNNANRPLRSVHTAVL
jgi:hypothetical protein